MFRHISVLIRELNQLRFIIKFWIVIILSILGIFFIILFNVCICFEKLVPRLSHIMVKTVMRIQGQNLSPQIDRMRRRKLNKKLTRVWSLPFDYWAGISIQFLRHFTVCQQVNCAESSVLISCWRVISADCVAFVKFPHIQIVFFFSRFWTFLHCIISFIFS